MAATFHWAEDNGAQTGSPLHGTIQSGFGADTHYPIDVNWKNVDDNTANSGTAYSAAPITAGNNSFPKYQYGHFSGSFASVFAGLWSPHTAGTLGANLTLVGKVLTAYATPATSALGGSPTDYSSIVAIGSGATVLFSTTGPYGAGPASSIASEGYSQYLVSQLQTAIGAAAGDTASITATLQYNEN